VIDLDAATEKLLSKSRATAIRAFSLSAGGFVLFLLATAWLRDEPWSVIVSYVALLGVFALCLKIYKEHPTWAGTLVCLGPLALITGIVAVRGGIANPPAMLAYMTLVVLAALCGGSRGAFILSGLGSLIVGGFALQGPALTHMGHFQAWAEITFQLVLVAVITHVLLRAVSDAARQTLRAEAEEHSAHVARLALEARVLESRSLEAVGRLAGGVAHDFNNLLTVILSSSENLLRQQELSPLTREELLRVEDAATRAAKLTQQLLAVGRKQLLSPVVLCPAEKVRELEPLLRRLLPATTELVLELDPSTDKIKVDESRLEQILLNLVTNASEAMPDGGQIRIVTESRSLKAPLVSGPVEIPAGDYVVISVSDTGAGMSPEVVQRIFEPFFTTKGFGTGLGLATVLGIVQQSRGYVDVESELGRGSTFRVYLPRTVEAKAPAEKRISTRPSSSAHILLVEDEEAVRNATHRLLESLGHTVIDAKSGKDALEVFSLSGNDFDILISDVVMPGLTGPSLAAELWRRRPDLKVLFLSGYPADQLPLSEPLPHQSRYLQKPFSRAELSAKIASMLSDSEVAVTERSR
jgi:signal transduction histidine kinase/ActR/RegA family two-component response regulator